MDKIIIVKDCRTCPKQYWNEKVNEPYCSLLKKDCLSGQGVPLMDCPLENMPTPTFSGSCQIKVKKPSTLKETIKELTEQKEYCLTKEELLKKIKPQECYSGGVKIINTSAEGLIDVICGKPIPAEKKESPISKCCNASVHIEGISDFPGDKKSCTQYYVCDKCGEACDLAEWNKEPKPKDRIDAVDLLREWKLALDDWFSKFDGE